MPVVIIVHRVHSCWHLSPQQPAYHLLVPWKLVHREEAFWSIAMIPPCPMTKVCGILSNRILPPSPGGTTQAHICSSVGWCFRKLWDLLVSEGQLAASNWCYISQLSPCCSSTQASSYLSASTLPWSEQSLPIFYSWNEQDSQFMLPRPQWTETLWNHEQK